MREIVQTEKSGVKDFFQSPQVKSKFEELLGKRASSFITSVLQVVASNDMLKNADRNSIYNAAATSATLDLPINNNLGFAYIVPYNVRQKDGSFQIMAQFQIGYKGFIQLAQRTMLFKNIGYASIYEGQIISCNPLTGYEFDFSIQPVGQPIGYAAYFKLLSGYEATLYMSINEMKNHGSKYSKTFKFGVWNTDFDGMAKKTVLKLLLSKFAPLSIDMQKAIEYDQSIISEDGEKLVYIDNLDEPINKEVERILLMINDCTNNENLLSLKDEVTRINNDEVTVNYQQKLNSLS